MSIIRGLAAALLSLLLLFSLSILGLVVVLNSTALNPGFAARELNKLDVPSLARELLSQQIAKFEIDRRYEPYVTRVMDGTITDLTPWMKTEANVIVSGGYDYILGKNQSLSLSIDLTPVRDSLKQNLRKVILASPPPELQGAPPGVIDLFLNAANQQIDAQVPQSITLDRNTLGPEAFASLEQMRQVASYRLLALTVLLVFSLLLAVLIFLAIGRAKTASRVLGTVFLACGAVTYGGGLLTRSAAGANLAQLSVPRPLQVWLPRLLADTFAVLDIYCLVLAAIGVALLVISFVHSRRTS